MPRNINLFILRKIEGRPLVLMYDKSMLEKTLSGGAARCFLSGFGYPAAAFSIPRILRYLKKRFSGGESANRRFGASRPAGIPGNEFPHEVGLLLGYPLEDVAGFVRHNGQNYKLCGYWKVYGNVEKAKSLFRQYDLCRERMKRYTRLEI